MLYILLSDKICPRKTGSQEERNKKGLRHVTLPEFNQLKKKLESGKSSFEKSQIIINQKQVDT